MIIMSFIKNIIMIKHLNFYIKKYKFTKFEIFQILSHIVNTSELVSRFLCIYIHLKVIHKMVIFNNIQYSILVNFKNF